MIRSITIVLMSLVLGLASVSMAVARAEMRGAETITICSGSDVASIAVDANGNPLKAVHLCPDCVAGHVLALLPEIPQRLGPPMRASRAERPRPIHAPSQPVLAPQARGPPLLA